MDYGKTSKIVLEDGTEVDGIKVNARKKAAVLRFPTAKEQDSYYIDAVNRQGKATDDDEIDLTAELELFKSLRLDQGEEWDEYEANFVISRLLHARVLSSEESGDEQVITIHTQFGEHVHTLRQPSFKEMSMFERAVNKTRVGKTTYGHVHKLYNALLVKTDGYPNSFTDDDIPGDHKSLCIQEIRIAHFKLDPIQIDPNA